jgi:hypothetical protein
MRCTQATLEALGVYGKCPQFGTGVVEALKGAGYKLRMLEIERTGLRAFIEAHRTGRYYLASEGHAMALVDGTLTDTSERAISNRIKVWGAFEVIA